MENPQIFGLITAILKGLFCLCTLISQLSMTLLFLFKQKGPLSLMLQVWFGECASCDAIIPNPAQKDEVIWTQSSNGMGSSQSLVLGILLDIKLLLLTGISSSGLERVRNLC